MKSFPSAALFREACPQHALAVKRLDKGGCRGQVRLIRVGGGRGPARCVLRTIRVRVIRTSLLALFNQHWIDLPLTAEGSQDTAAFTEQQRGPGKGRNGML